MTLGLARAGASVVISAARQVDEVRAVADDINAALGARRARPGTDRPLRDRSEPRPGS
jgi:hypothetical protein